jgi:hypothetical protein
MCRQKRKVATKCLLIIPHFMVFSLCRSNKRPAAPVLDNTTQCMFALMLVCVDILATQKPITAYFGTDKHLGNSAETSSSCITPPKEWLVSLFHLYRILTLLLSVAVHPVQPLKQLCAQLALNVCHLSTLMIIWIGIVLCNLLLTLVVAIFLTHLFFSNE